MTNNFQILKELVSNHRALNHPLFTYLNNPDRHGFNTDQFKMYWYNYLLRTLNTIPSIANVVKAAAINSDMENLALAGKNLWEETGKGNEEDVHINLLINSHNIHAKHIFKLKPIDISTISEASEIILETREFLNVQNDLYTNNSYNIIVGANYAQESAASGMLEHFYNGFFKKYIDHYSYQNDWLNICKYFDEHLDGTEEQHSLNAEKIVIKRYTVENNAPDIFHGANEFLNSQSRLWDGLLEKLKSLEESSKVVEFSISK